MMFQSTPLHIFERQRPFWLLVALAIMLLVCVSITVAEAASPIRLAGTLQRNLAALRVQLEQIEPWTSAGERRTVAFNADLGDGSAAFRRQSMVTMTRAAGRRLDQLIAAYREARDDERRRVAEALSLGMVDLTGRVDRLAGATSPATVVALRGEAEAALDRLERSLAQLSSGQAATLPALGGLPARR
jgi:hypothetical protein